MQKGICRYCGQEVWLIDSHIIPKSFYLLKQWGQCVGIDAKQILLDKVHSQNGFKEPLLCKACDNKLGYLDNCAYQFLFHDVPRAERCQDGLLEFLLLKPRDFNYNNIRRFFVSLLWRASISSKIPYSLGRYENIALQILKHERTDSDNLFVPLIYRREINTNLDIVAGVMSKSVMGNIELCLGFPHYQIIFIKDFLANKDAELAQQLRLLFARQGIRVYCIKRPSVFEYAFLHTLQQLQTEYLRLK